MSATKLSLVFLAVTLSYCEAYKFLVVFPMPGKSHAILGNGYVRNLLKDGHEVTYISPFPYESASPKLRVIDVSENLKAIPGETQLYYYTTYTKCYLVFEESFSIKTILNKEVNMMDHAVIMYMMLEVAKMTIANENVQKLLNDPKEQFDAVIAEWMFSELYAGIGAVYDCPFIWSSSVDPHWAILRLIDQPANPSYTGDATSSSSPPFTFWQRAMELYTQLRVQILKYMIFDPMERRAYENLIAPIITKRGRQPPAFEDLLFNASLVLGNSHVSLGQATPIPQSYIAVGGYHIEEDVKSLSKDLKKIMDDASNGVIYFSMGSNLKSKDIPDELKDSILTMFGELKQTVLWKFEEDLPNKPKNVHILNWAPQPSILSHPNTVVFISHGGLLSTTETVHFGVPIIGIPVFADQFINVVRAVQRGFAQKVDLSYNMAQQMKLAIEEVLRNPKYGQNAKELSLIYHDRPVTPGKELVHWIKHVVRTRGAPHLRSPAINVPFYQKLYLDLLAIILVILYVFVRLLKCVYQICFTKKNVNSKKKNN